MKKRDIRLLVNYLFTITVIITITSASDSSIPYEKQIISATENTILSKNTELEKYTWFNGNREEYVFAAPDEVVVFRNTSITTTSSNNNIDQYFDHQTTKNNENEFVTLLHVSGQSDIDTIKRKMDDFQVAKDTTTSFIFYRGHKKDQAPMGLTGEIIVHFKPDWNENQIKQWTKDMDIEIIKSFSFSPNTYLLKAGPGIKSLDIANQIYLSGDVVYAYPNWWKTMNTRSIPNDPLFPDQWHLENTGQGEGLSGEDVNIISVWDTYKGTTGEVIAIVDDGLEISHEDLAPNILPDLCWDYVENDIDPTGGEHGTSVAGVAAASGWNSLGITGAGPQTNLVGYRLLDAFTDANAADALTRNMHIVDIYSNSWGPVDDAHLEEPGPLTQAAIANGTSAGRCGKGNIYVWSCGNGNEAGDNSNYDGYANSRYAMAIAATNNSGKQSYYSEKGANILVNAPSNGGSMGITTTDRTGILGYNTGNYTYDFGGTSSSTPLVSGIISLMLQANPELTWRDIRLILAETSMKNDPDDPDWTVNGAGYNINHKYGFGRIDAQAAVDAASCWVNTEDEIIVSSFSSPNLPIPDNNSTGISDTIYIPEDFNIEFVEIYFTSSDHTYWGDLEIELSSPLGTKSILSGAHVPSGPAGSSYNNWSFGSVRHMGESSQGTWKLTVRDMWIWDTGTFESWGIKVYGPGHPNVATIDSASGTGRVTFISDAGRIEDLNALLEFGWVENPDVDFPHGLFSFNITELSYSEAVNVTIIFPQDIPTKDQYWKYNGISSGWGQMGIDSDDGDNIIILRLQDGGIGDGDGVADGRICDPGGPGMPQVAVSSVSLIGVVVLIGLLGFIAIRRI